MNLILFVEIVAWIGAVVCGAGFLGSLFIWYYHNFTESGEREVLRMRLQGLMVTNYKIAPRGVAFAVCVAALIAIYFG